MKFALLRNLLLVQDTFFEQSRPSLASAGSIADPVAASGTAVSDSWANSTPVSTVALAASAKEGDRTCTTTLGGQVVCGDLVIGITLEQYEAGLKKRAEEIGAEEAEKRIQLQKLVELTDRAASAEKDTLRSQIAVVEAEKRALEAESKGVVDRLTNLQAREPKNNKSG